MKIKLLTLALMSGFALAACSADDNDADMAATTPDPAMTDPATDPMATTPDPMTDDSMAAPGADMDIVANASNSPDHTTLVSAVQAVELMGLKDKLSDDSLKVSGASAKATVGASSEAGNSLSQNINSLPSMVGGC